MTEPGKNAPGLTGFPTPNSADSVSAYLLFLFPDPLWAQWVLGAVKVLEAEYNWYESGDMSVDDAAEAFRLINQQAPYNIIEDQNVPPPFWDDGTDVDASAPPDDQHWYGELIETMSGMGAAETTLTFSEELRLWLIVGFVAIAGSPLAAIAFAPFARKFVLTLKAGSAGAIVRVFFDGLHLADIDTYGVEDQIIEFLVDVGVEPSGEELWVEHSGEHNEAATPDANGNYTIQVVREKLTADTLIPPNTRYDADCDCVQTTYDGGETWVDNPYADPRHSPLYLIPPVTDARCAAAGGMVQFTRNWIGLILEASEVLGTANAVLALLLLLTGGAGLIFDAIIAIVEAVLAIGVETIDGAFNTEAYDNLLCCFYCNIGANGEVTADDIPQIQAQIDSDIGGTVSIVMALFFSITGEVMLQNAGVKLADSEADCSSCGCTWCIRFTPSVSGTYVTFEDPWGTAAADGALLPGVVDTVNDQWCMVSGSNGVPCASLRLEFDLPDGAVLTDATYYYDYGGGTRIGGVDLNGNITENTGSSWPPSQAGYTGQTITGHVTFLCYIVNNTGTPGGGYIAPIEIKGTGDRPMVGYGTDC